MRDAARAALNLYAANNQMDFDKAVRKACALKSLTDSLNGALANGFTKAYLKRFIEEFSMDDCKALSQRLVKSLEFDGAPVEPVFHSLVPQLPPKNVPRVHFQEPQKQSKKGLAIQDIINSVDADD